MTQRNFWPAIFRSGCVQNKQQQTNNVQERRGQGKCITRHATQAYSRQDQQMNHKTCNKHASHPCEHFFRPRCLVVPLTTIPDKTIISLLVFFKNSPLLVSFLFSSFCFHNVSITVSIFSATGVLTFCVGSIVFQSNVFCVSSSGLLNVPHLLEQ